MTIGICGAGWVTPAGQTRDEVWAAVRAGVHPTTTTLTNPLNGREFPLLPAVDPVLRAFERSPRLRRASRISHLAMAATLDALADAGIDPAVDPDRLGLVGAVSDGGVVYTRKFFAEIAASGVQAGSPLLFPETVYNAPLSHIAACLGVTGTATTLVGDATVSFSALATAIDLVASGECDHCVVVAAEESDWILCEGYSRWGFVAAAPPVIPHSGHGTVFAEGAAAVVIGHNARLGIPTIHPGASYRGTHEGSTRLTTIFESLRVCSPPDAVMSSASGASLDMIERDALARVAPDAPTLTPKVTLGESFAAASLAQVICASLWLADHPTAASVLVPVVGFNGQLAGLRLDREAGKTPLA